MKELDFDELDRAVNSLMTNVPNTPPPKKDDEVRTLNIESSLPDATATPMPSPTVPVPTPTPVESVAPAPVSEPVTPRTSAPSLSVAARRGGRFMDVVHPSSDMKKPTTPPSRQGVTIEPSQTLTEEAPKEAPAAAASTAATMPTSVTTTSESEWPDPLDMADFDAKDTEKPAVDTSEPKETPKEEATPPLKEPEQPLSTPFLPDAKVEKRPLGAPTPAEEPDRTPVLSPESSQGSSVNDPDDQLPALPKDVEPILPAELQDDLMAIEADTNAGIPKTEEGQPIENLPKQKPIVATVTPEPPVSNGPTSIPQQYREEPSTGDQGNGAIYDTDTYHKPIEHPAKKKSGWMWVIWILIILVVGAGGGAALFFLRVI
jgi:hypothetical protein